MRTLVVVMALILPSVGASAMADWIDHGVPVPLGECRGVVVTQDGQGRNVALSLSMDTGARAWLVITDLDTGKTEQFWLPEAVKASAPYGSVLGKNGKLYSSQGATLFEFDITSRTCTFHGVPGPDDCYIGMIEAPDGVIYAGGYPGCHLVSFDPKTRQMADYGQMDPQEMYLSTIAVDKAGWVYCGIGVARQNIVALNPATRERRQLVDEASRTTGTGQVRLGTDGSVYGFAGKQWYLLSEGKATPIEEKSVAPAAQTGSIGWGAILNRLPDGRVVTGYELEDKWIDLHDPKTDTTKRITFDYKSEARSSASSRPAPAGSYTARPPTPRGYTSSTRPPGRTSTSRGMAHGSRSTASVPGSSAASMAAGGC
jgi:hypothetical protein